MRGPERKKSRKVLFSVLQTQPDSTNPVMFLLPQWDLGQGQFCWELTMG